MHSVLECVGTEQAIDDSVAMARPGGAVGRVRVPHYNGVPAQQSFTRTSSSAVVRRRFALMSMNCYPMCSRGGSSQAAYSTV